MKKLFKEAELKLRRIFDHFLATEGFLSATALAYTTLLSLVPLMILSLGIFSIFPSFRDYILLANQFLFNHFVPSSANEIANQVAAFAQSASEHSLTSFMFSLFSCLILIFSLETSFNLIWKTKGRRSFFKALGIYFVALLLVPMFMGVLIAVHVFLSTMPLFESLESLLGAMSLAFSWLLFCLLYKFLPNCPIKFSHAAIGALISAILFELLKKAFGIYIIYFSSYTLIYGTLAAVPIFLTWLYLSWIVVLLGSVVSYVLNESKPID